MIDSTLVVTDLDGTFVYDSQTVHHKDAHAIKEIQSIAAIAIATGRSVKEVQYIEKQVGITVDYCIAFNGAFVQDKSGNILVDKPMKRRTIERLSHLFAQYNIVFDALDGQARWGNFQHERLATLWGMKFVLLDVPYSVLQDKKIYKINIRPQESGVENIIDLLKQNVPELNAYQTGLQRIELVRKDVSKAAGISACVKDARRIVAIGDASNDIEMFNMADISYCIAHAPQTVRRQAQKTVPYFADAIHDLQNNYNVTVGGDCNAYS